MTEHVSGSIRARRALLAALIGTGAALGIPAAANAQWSTVSEQFYLPGAFNWQFRTNYPAADRLFNAFDYGHAILYERLYTAPNAPVSVLEDKEFNFITRKLLVTPPRVPLEETAIEVAYAKIAPEAKMMFDWAHLLHRQIYDVWSDERLSPSAKDAKVAELIRYYKTRRDLAFSSQPKTMELMEGQYYSTAFRERYPKFNGLIWAYHWLQVGLYEPLVTGKNLDERQTGVIAAVARFRQMIENAPSNMPRIMPMTEAVAPQFSARYPEAAIIFDNLHAMHDVVSDILASDKVPHDKKRAEILKAAARYRDATSFVTTPAEWRGMTQMMGVENMGGPAVAFLVALPTPTVERGALMVGMEQGGMKGMAGTSGMAATTSGDSSHAMANMPGMGTMAGKSGAGPDTAAMMAHGDMKIDGMKMDGMAHGGMKMDGMAHGDMKMDGMDHGGMKMDGMSMKAMSLQMRMFADPVIRARVATDTALRRMVTEMIDQMPADHQAMMRRMLDAPANATEPKTPAAKPSPAKQPKTHKAGTARTPAPVKKPEQKQPPPMDMKMPGMGKP